MHGVLGQTWRNGKPASLKVVNTTLVVEGKTEDYIVKDGVWGKSFTFNLFGTPPKPKTVAPPKPAPKKPSTFSIAASDTSGRVEIMVDSTAAGFQPKTAGTTSDEAPETLQRNNWPKLAHNMFAINADTVALSRVILDGEANAAASKSANSPQKTSQRRKMLSFDGGVVLEEMAGWETVPNAASLTLGIQGIARGGIYV